MPPLGEIALGWLTLRSSEPLPLIEAAAAGGFGSVGMKLAPRPGEDPVMLCEDALFRRQVRGSLERNGVGVFNIGSLWLDGEREAGMFRPAIEAGVELGGRRAIAISIDPEPGRRTDQLGRLAALCGEYEIELAIEFFAYSSIGSLEEAVAMTRAVNADNLTILVDALHFARSGGTVEQLAAIPPGRLGWFQLCDAPARHPGIEGLSFEGGKDRLDPGEGGLPLAAWLRALPHGTRIEVEIPRLASQGLSARERGIEVAARVRDYLQEQGKRREGTIHEDRR